MIYHVEVGLQHQYERTVTEANERRSYWAQLCRQLPMSLGTACKSLYDVCNKTGCLPEVRRVALDVFDVRASLEQFGDVIRWNPPDHMRVGSLTKSMPTDLMTTDLRDMSYFLVYDQDINDTKRAWATMRKH